MPKKSGLDNLKGPLEKIGRRVFWRGRGGVDAWYKVELKIRLADVSPLNFDQSFLQLNAKKKITASLIMLTSQWRF